MLLKIKEFELSPSDYQIVKKPYKVIYFAIFEIMQLRYLKVFKRKIFLFILIVGLIVASSVTKGKTAVVISTITGILLIVVAVYYIIWIMKTPVKKENDEAL